MHNFKQERKFYLTRSGFIMLGLALPLIGYGATLVSDATLADVLLAGMVLAVFGVWRRWGRFRGEKPEWYRSMKVIFKL